MRLCSSIEDIRLGSPRDASNNLDSDFHMLVVTKFGNPIAIADHHHHHQRRVDLYRGESAPRSGAEPQQGLGGHGPPKILKNYFILCISIKNFKYLATKIEVGPPKCLSYSNDALKNQ